MHHLYQPLAIFAFVAAMAVAPGLVALRPHRDCFDDGEID